MFKYSCSATHLANWVFSQVSDQPGAIFPRRKGWSIFARTFYPAGSDRSMLSVMAANNSECVTFLPIDDNVDERQIKGVLTPTSLEALKKEFRQLSSQLILIAPERQEERVMQLLEDRKPSLPLLVLYSDRIEFCSGNFNNPRLEFRLSQSDYDPDLIPGFFHDSRIHNLETVQKSQYYQTLFHILNQCWLERETQVPLRWLVSRTIPCWSHFRKAEQKKAYRQVQSELGRVFREYFGGLVRLETRRKKKASQPEEVVLLPEPPDSRKAVSDWNRKQRQALSFLNESNRPLSIEELELFIN